MLVTTQTHTHCLHRFHIAPVAFSILNTVDPNVSDLQKTLTSRPPPLGQRVAVASQAEEWPHRSQPTSACFIQSSRSTRTPANTSARFHQTRTHFAKLTEMTAMCRPPQTDQPIPNPSPWILLLILLKDYGLYFSADTSFQTGRVIWGCLCPFSS